MDSGILQEGLIGLERGELLRLRDAAGRHIGVARGTAWVTQEGDPRDRIVAGGESLRLERNGVSLVMPLGGEAGIVLEDGLRAEPVEAQRAKPLDWDELLDRMPAFERRARRMRAEAFARVAAALAGALTALWRRVSGSLATVLRQRHTANELHALSDHILKDVGLRRDQIACAARRVPC